MQPVTQSFAVEWIERHGIFPRGETGSGNSETAVFS